MPARPSRCSQPTLRDCRRSADPTCRSACSPRNRRTPTGSGRTWRHGQVRRRQNVAIRRQPHRAELVDGIVRAPRIQRHVPLMVAARQVSFDADGEAHRLRDVRRGAAGTDGVTQPIGLAARPQDFAVPRPSHHQVVDLRRNRPGLGVRAARLSVSPRPSAQWAPPRS